MKQIEQTLTSLEVAEMVGREHKEVLRDIRNIITQLGESKIAQSYFTESTYTNSQNREMPSFLLTKKGCELYATRMTGEKGTQFAVAYIERFNEMENHIESNALDTSQFSPELQALIGIEQRQNEQDKRLDVVENNQKAIKDTLSLNTIGWREKTNNIINTVAKNNGGTYKQTRNKTYSDLELRAKCDLQRRLTNMVDRAKRAGASKKEVNNLNFLDVIEADQKLIEIYMSVVKELGIKYGVGAK